MKFHGKQSKMIMTSTVLNWADLALPLFIVRKYGQIGELDVVEE